MLPSLAGDIQIDRRFKTRYPLRLSARYRTGGSVGTGQTLNVSSNGLFVACEHHLVPGATIELGLDWPYLLDGDVPLQLALRGRIVRVEGPHCGIALIQHRFRTAKRAPAFRHPPPQNLHR